MSPTDFLKILPKCIKFRSKSALQFSIGPKMKIFKIKQIIDNRKDLQNEEKNIKIPT